MSTLPLDLILYISDIGNLSIKDVFHLSQVNKLFREKLSHPYFWHMVYNQKIGRIYELFGISEPIPESNYYKLCREHYRIFNVIEQELNDFNESKNYKIRDYITKYSLNSVFLPTLLFFLRREDFEIKLNIRNKSSAVEFSKGVFLANLVAGQSFNIGIKMLSKFFEEPLNSRSYESFWFAISLLQKKSFKIIKARNIFLEGAAEILRKLTTEYYPLPLVDDHYTFKTVDEYSDKVSHYIQLLYQCYCDIRCEESNYLEATNLLSMYSGRHKGDQLLVASSLIKVVDEQLDALDIRITSGEEKPKLLLTSMGTALIGDYCVPFLTGHPRVLKKEKFLDVCRSISEPLANRALLPITKVEIQSMICYYGTALKFLDGRDVLSPPCHPSTYCDDTFTFFAQFILPCLFRKEVSNFNMQILLQNVREFLDDSNHIYYPIFSRLPILSGYPLLIEIAPQYLQCNYSPNNLQGKIVITNRSDVAAIVLGTCSDSSLYQVLNAYGELEQLRDTSFTVVDNVSTEEVETFIELVGLANLLYVRIKGVSLKEGEEPRFIIE
ncbi:conserved hypothetical protein [Candida dubliniensis CD36]|uniref:F-box domain-containing protein n=1 Tax=Candida dubliniensis (strain CD36 / ATCC MYA-646 / CBS 7987 / NCPF 3949 / NRRL Y-17841) TaxID=573826 RepID=B9WJV8_CANDC|nr:conserved hypothetical protein [Candida dubliniensis CD36]CAX40917.1 conserved hypothetical protein [Candida dubliniensis CD36]